MRPLFCHFKIIYQLHSRSVYIRCQTCSLNLIKKLIFLYLTKASKGHIESFIVNLEFKLAHIR